MYSTRMDYNVTQDSAAKVSDDLAKVFADYLKLNRQGSIYNIPRVSTLTLNCLRKNFR